MYCNATGTRESRCAHHKVAHFVRTRSAVVLDNLITVQVMSVSTQGHTGVIVQYFWVPEGRGRQQVSLVAAHTLTGTGWLWQRMACRQPRNLPYCAGREPPCKANTTQAAANNKAHQLGKQQEQGMTRAGTDLHFEGGIIILALLTVPFLCVTSLQ